MERTPLLETSRAVRSRRHAPLGSAAVRARCREMARRGFVAALRGMPPRPWRGGPADPRRAGATARGR
jgi:hypothetical protein